MAACAVRKGLVVDRVEVDREALYAEEPVAVLARLPLFANVLECEPPVTRVVEDPIQEHADVPAVRVAHERGEVLVGAEAGIDALVVGRVVLMVRGSREDGCEVQTADAEIGKPSQVLTDAREVAAKEGLHRRRLAPRALPGRIVHLVAVREAVGED